MDATTFPLPLAYHIVLCVLGCVFFLAQFIRLKKPYQLMIAIAMPAISADLHSAGKPDIILYDWSFGCVGFAAGTGD